MNKALETRNGQTRDSWGRPVVTSYCRMTNYNEYDRAYVEMTSTEGGWAGSMTRAEFEAHSPTA